MRATALKTLEGFWLMPYFRKRPVVIEAFRFGHDTYPAWWSEAVIAGKAKVGSDGHKWKINTLEGYVIANRGDWIIKGVKGEFCPCKPDIFAETYEPCATIERMPDE